MSRRGFTIVEVVLVIGAVSLLLGLCSGLIHVLLRLDRVGRAHLVETATVGRLARQFRRDVHAAARVKLVARDDREGPSLELTLPDDRVVAYQPAEHALLRLQRQGVGHDRRETYSLPFSTQPRLSLDDQGGKTWVSLRLPRGSESAATSLRHNLQIDALVGRDRRRSQPAGKETLP
jgi:type II secretory pathway component PulJ